MFPPIPPCGTSGASARRKSRSRTGRVRQRAEGRIPVGSARIFWTSHPQTGRVTDVRVSSSDQAAGQVAREYLSPHWSCAVGDCDAGWLAHPAFTPEAVFGEMIETGFHTPADLAEALRQFARIDTCSWALPMLVRLEGSA